ncbi:hypothetical protein BSZ39_12655 [Bowdeniella nasicola]|uniref:Uncharacterized protein n=1 Tax=Bowdeniella nasicola TaxID=208480 RepID=A0A1Q5PWV1_9ACTO|nr:hypothetical protein BSZ39_12655 [Bowdeniella nasicola]
MVKQRGWKVEFLIYAMAALAAILIIFSPKRERLAFSLALGSFGISAFLYMVSVSGSWVPPVNL